MTTAAPVVDRLRLERGWLIGIAIVAIVLGIVGFLFPGASLLTIAIVFGVYLIAAGVYRVSSAVTPGEAGTGVRLLTGLFGGLIIVAGIFCLANPFGSIFALGTVIGIGWLLEGVLYLARFAAERGGRRWPLVVSAVLAIIAGIIMLTLPGFGIATLVVFGSILLVVLGVVALLNLVPRRV